MILDDLSLPLREDDRSLVLATRSVLREQTGPVLPVCLHHHSSRCPNLEDLHARTHSTKDGTDVFDDSRKCGVTGDTKAK